MERVEREERGLLRWLLSLSVQAGKRAMHDFEMNNDGNSVGQVSHYVSQLCYAQ